MNTVVNLWTRKGLLGSKQMYHLSTIYDTPEMAKEGESVPPDAGWTFVATLPISVADYHSTLKVRGIDIAHEASELAARVAVYRDDVRGKFNTEPASLATTLDDLENALRKQSEFLLEDVENDL